MSELKKHRGGANHCTHNISKRNPSLYGVWIDMRGRCENEKRDKYKDYGARGITVCPEWQDAVEFFTWAQTNGYCKGKQIDRIDNDGNYEPKNCRFVSPKQNSRNRRNTKFITINGETKCVAEWCESLSISRFTIYYWYRMFGREYAEKRCAEAII